MKTRAELYEEALAIKNSTCGSSMGIEQIMVRLQQDAARDTIAWETELSKLMATVYADEVFPDRYIVSAHYEVFPNGILISLPPREPLRLTDIVES